MNRLTHIATISLAVCITAGCWEVIPYKGEASHPPAAAETATPAANEPPGGDELFGDDGDAPADAHPRPAPAAEIVPPTKP